MKKLLILIAALLTVACAGVITPPTPPTPPAPKVQTVIVTLSAPVVCPVTVTGTAFSVTAPTVVNGDQATASVTFAAVPWALQTVTASAFCTNFLPSSTSIGTFGTGQTPINLLLTPVAPKPPPLPPAPPRDTLARVQACFQGVTVTTSDLGTVPSWGPDAWMHPLLADRLATYNAHKAAGCTHLTLTLGPKGQGYQEAGVAYPNNQASGNFFDDTDFDTLCQVTAEVITNGQFPLIAVGGDNDGPTFDYVTQHLPGVNTALMSCKQGNLKPYIVFLAGFDSVDELAQNNGSNVDDLLVFMRQTLGPDAVIAKENQQGWAFWSGCTDPAHGGGAYSCPGAQAVDVILQEFDSPPGPPAPAPTIIAGVWDPEHNDYAPVWSDSARGQSFERIWQVGSRTVPSWTVPPDEPIDVIVSNCSGGGPQDGATCHTGADGAHPPTYTAVGTSRGPYFIVAYEYFTYQWVRNQVTTADVIAAGLYFTRAGYQAAAGPTTAQVPSLSSPALLWRVHRPALTFAPR